MPIIEHEIKHTREQTEVKLGCYLKPFLVGLPDSVALSKSGIENWASYQGLVEVNVWFSPESLPGLFADSVSGAKIML